MATELSNIGTISIASNGFCFKYMIVIKVLLYTRTCPSFGIYATILNAQFSHLRNMSQYLAISGQS